MSQKEVGNVSRRAGGQHKYHAIKQQKNTINFSAWALWRRSLQGGFLANYLASNDNLTRTTNRQNTYQLKLTIHKKGTLINNNTV